VRWGSLLLTDWEKNKTGSAARCCRGEKTNLASGIGRKKTREKSMDALIDKNSAANKAIMESTN